MGTLGHKVFEPLAALSTVPADDKHPTDEEPLLNFENANAKATGRRTSEGFVVLKGSILSQKIAKSCPEIAIKARTKYKDKINESNTLMDDVLLSSPSAAAAFVGGSSLNGNELWKREDGRTLNNLEKSGE